MTDSAIQKYLELPVAKPAGARFAFAMLIARTQILGPQIPDELMVAAIRAGRVFVINAPTAPKIKPMPACRKIWQPQERQSHILPCMLHTSAHVEANVGTSARFAIQHREKHCSLLVWFVLPMHAAC